MRASYADIDRIKKGIKAGEPGVAPENTIGVHETLWRKAFRHGLGMEGIQVSGG